MDAEEVVPLAQPAQVAVMLRIRVSAERCYHDEDYEGLCYQNVKKDTRLLDVACTRPKAVDCVALGYESSLVDTACIRKTQRGESWLRVCQDDEEEQLGRCYPKCGKGYKGVGHFAGESPKVYGKQWVDCGMGSAVDSTTCGFAIADKIIGPIFAVVNIVSLGLASGPLAAARHSITMSTKLARSQSRRSTAQKPK